MSNQTPKRAPLSRAWRGLHSAAAGLAFPLGGWWLGGPGGLDDAGRLGRGLAVVLPGIEGRGPLNWSIARGLQDGGFPGAVLVHDWTTGLWPLFAYHLRAHRRGRRKAAAVAELIGDYQERYPGRPVHLIGHSGGGAVAVWALEALPAGRTVTTAVLLAPALSAGYNLAPALHRAENGVWNFWSPLDVIFLAAGTLLFGTSDGRCAVSAGFRGFTLPRDASPADAQAYRDRLRQRCFHPRMLGQFHSGGHLAWANRVFVAETVVPLLGGSG